MNSHSEVLLDFSQDYVKTSMMKQFSKYVECTYEKHMHAWLSLIYCIFNTFCLHIFDEIFTYFIYLGCHPSVFFRGRGCPLTLPLTSKGKSETSN